MIAQGRVEMDPFVSRVDEALCTGCQTCLTACPYEAVTRDAVRRVSRVSEALCTGCGTCVASCPSNAIQQLGFTHDQVIAEVDALLAPEPARGREPAWEGFDDA